MQDKKRLGVIFGSRSCEREVAIISAVQLMKHVDRERFDVVPVYIDEHNVWYTGKPLLDIRSFQPFRPDATGILRVFPDLTFGSGALLYMEKGSGLFARQELKTAARVDVFFVVMHGLNGEDGTLQGLLELSGVPYTSADVGASALGMDKILMKQFFRGADLPVLPSLWYTASAFHADGEAVLEEVTEKLGFPVFVKPAHLGSSIGVSRAEDPEELRDSLELAFSYDRRVLVEKGLDRPIELNCSVLGYDDDVVASPIEMPLSGEDFLDFSEKYLSQGGSKGMASLHRVLPAPIEDSLRDEIQNLSKTIFRLMDCKGCVRIDYMFDRASGGLYITEINTIPGSLAFYLWENAGMPYRELISRMVDIALRASEDKLSATYAFTSNILSSVSLGAKGAKGAKGSKWGGSGGHKLNAGKPET